MFTVDAAGIVYVIVHVGDGKFGAPNFVNDGVESGLGVEVFQQQGHVLGGVGNLLVGDWRVLGLGFRLILLRVGERTAGNRDEQNARRDERQSSDRRPDRRSEVRRNCFFWMHDDPFRVYGLARCSEPTWNF
jgi:hypothetical protein